IGVEASETLWDFLKAANYIDSRGRIEDHLRAALKDGTLALPEDREEERDQITAILRKLAGRLEIKDAKDRETITPRRAILESKAFQALWDRIKHKTTYRVEFDNEALITTCAEALENSPA